MILAGDQGKIVQGVLFLFCCASLIFKYWKNHGGRTLWEFGLDSSKQLCGAGWIHFMNIVFAEKLEDKFKTAGDECDWYWVNIVIDTTLGTCVTYTLLLGFTHFIKSALPAEKAAEFESGKYKNQDGTIHWPAYFKQIVVWLCIVSLMKASMVCLMILGHGVLLDLAQLVLGPVEREDSFTLKLLAVMVVTPTVMNSLQFWVTDNIIRKKEDEPYALLNESDKANSSNSKTPNLATAPTAEPVK